MIKMTYLDYNATTPLHPDVADMMTQIMAAPLNASSVHGYGREGRKRVETAREQVAGLVGAPPAQVVFGSGATEANNTVLRHFAGERVLVSSIEHPSVLEAGEEVETIPVTSGGRVDLDALEKLLKSGPRVGLVSVMLVNNETGAIQPVAEVSALAKKYGALVHCDAVQAAGRIPVDIAALGVDFMSLSAHKIGGPQGVGALVLGLCGITPVLLHGGGQEKKARAGTENVAGIAGFGLAAEKAAMLKETDFQDRLEGGLKALCPDVKIYAEDGPRVHNTTLFSVLGMRSESVLMAMDLEGIAVSNGSACSSGTVQPSHVLKAMGCSDEEASGAVRVSTGWNTKGSDIDAFLNAWEKIYNRVKRGL